MHEAFAKMSVKLLSAIKVLAEAVADRRELPLRVGLSVPSHNDTIVL